MASVGKRQRIVNRKDSNDYSDDSDDYDDSENQEWRKRKVYNPRSMVQVDSHMTESHFRYNARPKCFSKNALLARENRVRKKMYVENLENDLKRFRVENEQLKSDVNLKNVHIANLQHEVQYLKNILSNSKQIELLLTSINRATGLKTTSSMKSSHKSQTTTKNHPWEDVIEDTYDEYDNKLTKYLTEIDPPESILSPELTSNLSLDIFDPLPTLPFDVNRTENDQTDHNYSSISNEAKNDNYGICLHLSNEKVSLEFCSQCSQKSSDAWKKELD